MNSATEPCAPSRRFLIRQLRFLELKKTGKMWGYNFIGWLSKTGKLVKDECPQSPHTPIYWKKPETGEWFCFSQTALHETVIKDAILSVDDWKRLVIVRLAGDVHDNSHCVTELETSCLRVCRVSLPNKAHPELHAWHGILIRLRAVTPHHDRTNSDRISQNPFFSHASLVISCSERG